MPAFYRTWLAAAAAVAALAWGGAAEACCTPPPPPPCGCKPPPPPGGSTTTVNVTVNTSASAAANARSSAISGVTGDGYGGGGMYVEQAPAAGVIENLDVDLGESEMKRVAYQAVRKVSRKVLIQAVCLDDRDTPHPASQVHPGREVADDYDGEIYRCIAGTHMQATIGDYNDALTLANGETMSCDKMQALYHSPDGTVACRAQKPARDCNERSLLRRYGPGVKVLTLARQETYTAYREEKGVRKTGSKLSLTLDGGVGGFR